MVSSVVAQPLYRQRAGFDLSTDDWLTVLGELPAVPFCQCLNDALGVHQCYASDLSEFLDGVEFAALLSDFLEFVDIELPVHYLVDFLSFTQVVGSDGTQLSQLIVEAVDLIVDVFNVFADQFEYQRVCLEHFEFSRVNVYNSGPKQPDTKRRRAGVVEEHS